MNGYSPNYHTNYSNTTNKQKVIYFLSSSSKHLSLRRCVRVYHVYVISKKRKMFCCISHIFMTSVMMTIDDVDG